MAGRRQFVSAMPFECGVQSRHRMLVEPTSSDAVSGALPISSKKASDRGRTTSSRRRLAHLADSAAPCRRVLGAGACRLKPFSAIVDWPAVGRAAKIWWRRRVSDAPGAGRTPRRRVRCPWRRHMCRGRRAPADCDKTGIGGEAEGILVLRHLPTSSSGLKQKNRRLRQLPWPAVLGAGGTRSDPSLSPDHSDRIGDAHTGGKLAKWILLSPARLLSGAQRHDAEHDLRSGAAYRRGGIRALPEPLVGFISCSSCACATRGSGASARRPIVQRLRRQPRFGLCQLHHLPYCPRR